MDRTERDEAYWQGRAEILERATLQKTKSAMPDVTEGLRQAKRKLERLTELWLRRIAANTDRPIEEIRRQLTAGELDDLRMTLQEYIAFATEHAADPEWRARLENASAMRHIDVYTSKQIEAASILERAFIEQHGATSKALEAITADIYARQTHDIRGGAEGAALTRQQIREILNKPWTQDERTFSDRIWQNKQQLVGDVLQRLGRLAYEGANPEDGVAEMAERLDVAEHQARRLLVTEAAYVTEAAKDQSYKDHGVEWFKVVATLDTKTSELCQSMDGKTFKLSDKKIGINSPPFHPHCRTTTAPYYPPYDPEPLEGDDELTRAINALNAETRAWGGAKVTERAARDADGKSITITPKR